MFLNKKSIKKVVISVLAIALIIVMSSITYTNGYGAVFFGGSTRKLPIYSVDRNDNKIAISFDCAYGNEYTKKILDVLDEYKVKCTFFTVEFWANKYSQDLIEIANRGHEIGTHSKTHPNMSKLSKAQIIEELTSSKNVIESITGKPVTLFRPPFGDYDNLVIETAESLGLYTIQWDVDSLDWKDLSSSEITKRIVNKVKSGSIILCHNNALHTHEALSYVLSNLQEKGYTFVPIGELIYKSNYTINSFGKQVPNKS